MIYGKQLTVENVAVDPRLTMQNLADPLSLVRFVQGDTAEYEAFIEDIDRNTVNSPEVVTFTTDMNVARDPRVGRAAIAVVDTAILTQIHRGNGFYDQGMRGPLLSAAEAAAPAPQTIDLSPRAARLRLAKSHFDGAVGYLVGATLNGKQTEDVRYDRREFLQAMGLSVWGEGELPLMPFAFVRGMDGQSQQLADGILETASRHTLPNVQVGPLHYRLSHDVPLY